VSEPAKRDSVQSIERALATLECMADVGGEAGLIEISAATGLPVPTIHRLLRTLVAVGYVRQEQSRRYTLGPKLIRLGESAQQLVGVWARPLLAELAEVTGETANLAMLDGDVVVYVAQVPSAHAMRMFTEVGRRAPAHCTGVGKAILSQLDESTVRAILSRTGMPAQTPRTITDPDLFVDELAETRQQGYALDDGEQELAVRCIAVPVAQDRPRFAVSISGPDSRITGKVIFGAVPALHQAARRFSEVLGDTAEHARPAAAT
jgi:IclR family transcriptional regulator, acetate operon repressor